MGTQVKRASCPTCGGSRNIPLPPCVGAGAIYNSKFHPVGTWFTRAPARRPSKPKG